MLKNRGLFDPVQRTRDMRLEEFTKYTDLRDAQAQSGEKVDELTVNRIKRDFFEAHADVQKEYLDKVWKVIGPKIAENAGLAQFVEDYHGAASKYFFPWLISVYTSPSAALEMSYGAGLGLSGEWVYKIDDTDYIQAFVENDPTFVYNRERQLYVADLVTTVEKKATKSKPAKVVDLGAGRMAWARYHGFKFNPDRLKVIAFDKDPSIDPVLLFPFIPEVLGLEYHVADLHAAFAHPECKEADLIMLGGVASYYPMNLFQSSVMMPVHGFLKPGGVFFFDLQVSCPYLKRSMRVFDWPELVNFADSAAGAIQMVEDVRKSLWAYGLKFGAEYALDTYNEIPSSVMVTFTKL